MSDKIVKINNVDVAEILKNHISYVLNVESKSVEFFVDKDVNRNCFWFSGVAVHYEDKLPTAEDLNCPEKVDTRGEG